jgi:drug/metabolite transporter (DMT)-like permease
MDMSLVFGVAAALCWGSSDFVAKLAVAKIGYLRTTLFMQLVGIAFMFLITGNDVVRLLSFPTEVYLTFGLGAVNAIATVALFKSFEVGQLSIMSPIASSYPALTSVLALLLLNERVTQMRLLGIMCIFAGILFVSFQRNSIPRREPKRIASGVGYALTAFVFMGLLFFALKLVVIDLGGLLPVLVIRLVSASIVGAILLCGRTRSVSRPASVFHLVFFVGVVDSLANVAYNIGISLGTVAVVSFVSSLFSAITILLACVILRERLLRQQIIGIALIMLGIAIIGYFP